ncbi:hypothetical protein L0F63_000405, partial [Massospora cicadina]
FGSYGQRSPFGAQPYGSPQLSPYGSQTYGPQMRGEQFQPQAYGQQPREFGYYNQPQGLGYQPRNYDEVLYEVEQRIQQIQRTMQQDRQQPSNLEVSRQTAEIVVNQAEMARQSLEQAKQQLRMRQQQASSPIERQLYQQREQQLEQLIQTKDQIRQLAHQRANVLDIQQREYLGQQIFNAAQDAQLITRDMINQRQSAQIQTPFNPQNNYPGQFGLRNNLGQLNQYQAPGQYNQQLQGYPNQFGQDNRVYGTGFQQVSPYSPVF